MEITELTVHELIEKLKNKELTSTEITQSYIDRIKEKEPEVQAFVTTLEDEDTTYSNIDFNGYTLYVNGTAIN